MQQEEDAKNVQVHIVAHVEQIAVNKTYYQAMRYFGIKKSCTLAACKLVLQEYFAMHYQMVQKLWQKLQLLQFQFVARAVQHDHALVKRKYQYELEQWLHSAMLLHVQYQLGETAMATSKVCCYAMT